MAAIGDNHHSNQAGALVPVHEMQSRPLQKTGPDVDEKILSYLFDLENIPSCAAVCREWRRILENPDTYREAATTASGIRTFVPMYLRRDHMSAVHQFLYAIGEANLNEDLESLQGRMQRIVLNAVRAETDPALIRKIQIAIPLLVSAFLLFGPDVVIHQTRSLNPDLIWNNIIKMEMQNKCFNYDIILRNKMSDLEMSDLQLLNKLTKFIPLVCGYASFLSRIPPAHIIKAVQISSLLMLGLIILDVNGIGVLDMNEQPLRLFTLLGFIELYRPTPMNKAIDVGTRVVDKTVRVGASLCRAGREAVSAAGRAGIRGIRGAFNAVRSGVEAASEFWSLVNRIPILDEE